MTGQDKTLRELLFQEMSHRCSMLSNDQEVALFLKELTIVAATGFENVVGSREALVLLAGITNYVASNPAFQQEAQAMAELSAGVTVQ